jgi:hypothetical protein
MAQRNADGWGHFDLTRHTSYARRPGQFLAYPSAINFRPPEVSNRLESLLVQEAIALPLSYPQFGNRFFVQLDSQAWGIGYLQEAIHCYRFLVSDLVAQGSFFFDHEFYDERVWD